MILKCPECGHKVSDKAPVCPGCGIEISGHVLICDECGKAYFDSERTCPHCHGGRKSKPEPNVTKTETVAEAAPIVVTPIKEDVSEAEVEAPRVVEPVEPEPEIVVPMKEKVAVVSATPIGQEDNDDDDSEEGSNRSVFFISFIIAALILATMLYFYKDATDKQQAQQQADYAVVDSTEKVAEEVAEKQEQDAVATEEIDTVKPQLVVARGEEKPAEVAEKPVEQQEEPQTEKPENVTITDKEKQTSFQSVRKFFLAINSKNETALRSSTTEKLSSFRGKANASRIDVLSFMKDLYQADVTNLNWHLGQASSVKKVVTADGKTEYRITIPARRVIERGSIKSDRKFTVTATTTADGKVKAMEIGG